MHSGGKGRPRKRSKLLASPPRTPSSPRRHVPPRIHLANLSSEVKRSARLQNKRVVRYDEMVMGNHPFSDESSVDSPQITPVKSSPFRIAKTQNIKDRRQMFLSRRALSIPTVLQQEDDDDSNVSSDHENKDITNVLRPVFPEEHEIKRLRQKSRRLPLAAKEKQRLRRLRERVRRLQREHRRRVKERRLIAAEKQKNAQVKRKKNLHETHMYTKKYNQEHCYAACPENFDKPKEDGDQGTLQEIVVQAEDIKVEEVVIMPDASGETSVIHLQTDQVEHKIPEEVNISDIKQEQVVVGEIVVSEARSGDALEKAEDTQDDVEEKVVLQVKEEKVFLEIVHRDATRSSRGRWQDGILHMHLYKDRDASCVTCVMCNELLSVKRFMKHMHPHNRVDELLEITLPQRLELRRPDHATDLEKELWDTFQKLQDEYNKAAEKQARPRGRRSLESVKDEEAEENEEVGKCKKTPKAEPSPPKIEGVEKKANRSPKTQTSRENSTPVRNGQVSGGKGRTRDRSETRVAASKGTPLKTVKSAPSLLLSKLTPPPLSKLEMPPTVSPSESSPQDNNVRQSGRVRKRKQLHPCESYVFSSGRNLTADGVPESKRVRLDASDVNSKA